MLTIRTKTVLGISLVVVLMTVSNFCSNLLFTQKGLLQTMEKDLILTRDVVNDLISTHINLLKEGAHTVAERLNTTPDKNLEAVMKEQLLLYPNFMAFTLFERDRMIASCGYAPTPLELLYNSDYLPRAFNGESVISTTRRDAVTGQLVLHVCVPAGSNRVLSVTIPGMFFTGLVGGYRLWETGSILIIDEKGMIIASYIDSWVQERQNFRGIGRQPVDVKSLNLFYTRMMASDKGADTYYFNGQERLCVYERLRGSTVGWKVAIIAPMAESPANSVRQGLVFSFIAFLFLGMLFALGFANIIAKPYYRVEELSRSALAASEAKSNFLANMSHEMRTPLNAIIGLSELSIGICPNLCEASLDLNENIEKINSAGMTLLGTVNDILDISKIEAGKFELVPVDYDMPSLINDTVIQNVMRIGDKPIKFVLDIDGSLPSRLLGDDLRIKQVMNNILSNAIKYTKKGAVTLTIRCEREGDSIWFTASVSDSGIGIRKEDMVRLFSDYNQVDTKANRKIEGTGLGLAITKRMTEMMDGSITVESEYGKGSTFTIRIRQGYVTDEQIGEAVAVHLKEFKYSDQKRRKNARFVRISIPYARVLVVDDVATNLDVAKGMMKPYKMQIDCVNSGPAAIQCIRDGEKYNAIFMDHMMPDMDGIEAVRIIREEIGTDYAKTVPIIALTANAIRGNEEMFLHNGFQAFLSKPIDIEQLDLVIKQWVRNKELEETLPPAAEYPGGDWREGMKDRRIDERRTKDRRHNACAIPYEESPALVLLAGITIDGIDLERAADRFGGGDSLLPVLQSYIANTPPLLERLRNPTGETLPAYAVTVHGIKGSSRAICAETAGDKAEELEHAAKAGNIDFVREHNAAFIAAAEKLIAGLDAALKQIMSTKPKKDKPDPELLNQLGTAAAAYDMDEVDRIMTELERFDYVSHQDWIHWLREQIKQMDFQAVAEKISVGL